jgi:hypothetical protein
MDMGRDLCLALIINCNMELPPEILPIEMRSTEAKGIEKKHEPRSPYRPAATFELLAGIDEAGIVAEFLQSDELVHAGEDESSSGSDSEPSFDNLEMPALKQIVPMVTEETKTHRKRKLLKSESSKKVLRKRRTIAIII